MMLKFKLFLLSIYTVFMFTFMMAKYGKLIWTNKIIGMQMINQIETSLETFLEQYNEEISHVDFRLNTSKVVADVKKRTKSFMKKRK